MNSGSITARFVRTGMLLAVTWKDGIVTSVTPSDETAAERNGWIAPALVDLQINGYATVDFQQDDLSEDDLLLAVRALRRDGCTRFLFTLITEAWPTLMARLSRARALVRANGELRRAILGWHIEGPFLSPEPGYCGAHDPAKMIDASPKHVDELSEIVGEDPVLITVAPERSGVIAAIEQAVKAGMKVSLGHTNASSDQLRAAVEAGATGFTHLANGCPQTLDRQDNIIWRVLDTPGLSVSLIHDTHHVSPQLFRLIHTSLRPGAILHTTDAMSAAGAGVGRFRLGSLVLEVGEDGIVRQPGQTNFAGSSLTPIDGVFRAARMTGKPWQEMWLHSSLRPAEYMGWSSELKVGDPVDFCVLEVDENGNLVSSRTVCDSG